MHDDSNAMAYIDLSHTFTANMPTYPDDVPPTLVQIAGIEKEGYTDFQVTTGMHVGTHIDGPLHMIAGGKRLAEFPIAKYIGHGCLVDVRGKDTIDTPVLDDYPLQQNDIVLFYTGYSDYYRTAQYYEQYPVLTQALADALIDAQVSMIGVDSPSPDREPFLVHKQLLQHDILIIENLTNLAALLSCKSFTVIALPAKFDADSSPARVIAKGE